MKLPLRNALLKLQYVLHEGNGLPSIDEIMPHFETLRTAERHESDLLLQNGAVPPGARREYLNMERFNFQPLNVHLSSSPAGGVVEVRTLEIAWSNYVRRLFVPTHFYRFSSFMAGLYFFVGESKSFQYRTS